MKSKNSLIIVFSGILSKEDYAVNSPARLSLSSYNAPLALSIIIVFSFSSLVSNGLAGEAYTLLVMVLYASLSPQDPKMESGKVVALFSHLKMDVNALGKRSKDVRAITLSDRTVVYQPS
jgi:hypothetical protein